MNTTTPCASFSAPSTSLSAAEISSRLADLCRPRRPKAKMRVGNAPTGRILLIFMQMLALKALSAARLLATMNGVLAYLSDPAFTPDENVDPEIFHLITAEIDRSEHRSSVARERAALRKAAREALTAITPSAVPQTQPAAPTEPEPEATEPAPLAAETGPATEPEPEEAEPAPKPRRRREPDTIVSNYRPKKKPALRYRVLTDEEMNAEPYDPFGAHRAYEIQCGRRRW